MDSLRMAINDVEAANSWVRILKTMGGKPPEPGGLQTFNERRCWLIFLVVVSGRKEKQ